MGVNRKCKLKPMPVVRLPKTWCLSPRCFISSGERRMAQTPSACDLRHRRKRASRYLRRQRKFPCLGAAMLHRRQQLRVDPWQPCRGSVPALPDQPHVTSGGESVLYRLATEHTHGEVSSPLLGQLALLPVRDSWLCVWLQGKVRAAIEASSSGENSGSCFALFSRTRLDFLF